ncbi:MAG TPA: hybrid sensor histidine kinase/response regulator, partial [Steroidobacter sp.]|nr:hybrid sensor histidine kinase/response regulator [Steroidobacter sp.]
MDAVLQRRVEQQRVAMLYGNTLALSSSALLMAALIVVIVWPHGRRVNLALWAGCILLVQFHIQWLSIAYRRAKDRDTAPREWGWRLALAAAAAGVVWGAAPFVLATPEQSLTIALLSACLAGRVTISVMTHAYFPPALHSFAAPVFSLLALRYMTLGGYGNAALGIMWIAVLGYVLLFVDRQARAAVAQIRVRCENEQLVEQLRQQNDLAEHARARAEEASRSKSLFFAAANHDLRQPLHSLGLFATALRNAPADEASRRLIDQILQCTESLEQLFDNLLDISRLEAGQVAVKREVVNADAVLERLRSTFAQQAQEKGLRLSVRRSRAMLTTDPTLLFRILSNLVANAIRYTERGGVIVACRRRGRVASIEVWDSGIGIPREQHRRIFEEFYQLNNPSRDRTRGLGLGLATVRRIGELLDHPLRLRSTPGRGSCFCIEAPLADPANIVRAPSTVEQMAPNLIGGKLIVVIDDEASVRLGMHSLLTSWGAKCVATDDAEEALAALGARTPDFIIADLRLRDERDGIEVIGRLRAKLG